eukprot:scaffold19313_cov75-Skeletonema_dohrnii-CCMP3373.AAC.5
MLNLHLSIEASSIFYNLLMIISGLPRVKTARNVRGVSSNGAIGCHYWADYVAKRFIDCGRRRSTASASASEEV